jgi:cyclopropane fatty-acyl-phospholipid synthase-like methyltransferase
MAARGSAALSSYAIAGGEEGKARLDLLADAMGPTTLRLLEQAGLRSGDRCLDVGCGGGHVALDMARIVGPTGSVLGIDFDPMVIELARADAQKAGVDNVAYLTADAQSFEGGPFSFVYARFLLSHVSAPERVFSRFKSLLSAGGRIAVEDIDMSCSFCHPPDWANYRFVEIYTEVVRRGGGDADLGRRLPAVALKAGLRDARWTVFQPVYASGPHKRVTAVTMERIRAAVLRHGLAGKAEIDAVVARLTAFADDPSTLVALPRMVQVWGAV